MKQKVLMIGLASNAVDYDKWPDLSPEKLEAAFEQVVAEMIEAGFDARWCLTPADADAALAQIETELIELSPDIVLVGAGVRTDPDHLLLFEAALNAFHQHAPQAKICFNSLPYDSVEAVKRWA